ncbi:gastrula zinc finger protein XlCGF49.1-like [Cololabis saira]|uniref:gastrula zinc finger protein XlCGF49.1-like n=1 Tax=Cololabis saira TaxID=129043 RepID=UPI002AD47DDD|nr:gastrula zinc finger protein XlCGF49.1-like [Cololabis saira]
MLTSRYQERDFPDPEPDAGNLYFHSSPLADDQNQDHVQILDSGPTADLAMAPRKRPRGRSHVGPSSLSHGRFHAQSGKKTVKCDVCGKFFRDKHDMQRHYRIHTGERPYECKVCRKSFTQNGTLLVHMKTHTGEKPFLCSTCGKNFPMRWILVAHMRIHTGERPYSCGECGKNFTHKNSLKHHMNISHDGNS